jgi:hypothetical protein
MTADEFSALASVPESADATLIVSENLLDIAKQCELLGVKLIDGFESQKHSNFEDAPGKIYWRYGLEPGKATRGMPVEKVRHFLERKSRRPATTVEVLAIYAHNSKLLTEGVNLDAAGSIYDDARCVHLCRRVREVPVQKKSDLAAAAAAGESKAVLALIQKKQEILKVAEEELEKIRLQGRYVGMEDVQRRALVAGVWTKAKSEIDALERFSVEPQVIEEVELAMALISKGHPDWGSPSFRK